MYEIDSIWRKYFTMDDPIQRLNELNRLLSIDEYKNEYSYAKEIFDNRHTSKKQAIGEVDRFLFNCVVLISLYKSGNIFKKANKKEIIKMMTEMGCEACDGGTNETIVYWELRNAVARYFKTCNSPGYRRKLFGVMSASDDDKQQNMIMDAWKMSVGLSEKHDLFDKMRVWNLAVKDEFSCLYDGADRALSEYAPKKRK